MDYMNLLDNLVEGLYKKQNEGALKEHQGLYTKKQYYELLKPVVDVISNNKDATIEEMRNILFEKSGIEEQVKNFIYKKEMVPGMVFTYGTKNYKETIVIGNRQEVALDANGNLIPSVEQMTEDTIFDLASVTKLFTGLSILKLLQDGNIKLDDEINKYAPQFKNLKGITIYDLLSFGVPLKTNGRVDRANSREEAEQILFDIEVDKENENKRPYTDMGAMILKYIVENVSGKNYYEFVDKNILSKVHMKDTHVVIPSYKLDRVASTNFDGKYYKDGNFSVTTSALRGVVYDPKAQIMGQTEGNLSGHAGLFSTANDMTNLAKGIMGGQIIDEKYVEMMAKNRTGRVYVEDDKEKYVQYLGFMCYSKNPILADSELFHAMSRKAFASAGWTGTQLTIDPINELYFFMAGNRSHNRMTFIDPAQRDKVEVDENGKKTILLPDGSIRIDSTRFAWDRDEVVVHPALKLAIQYKALEDILEYSKEQEKDTENIRHL